MWTSFWPYSIYICIDTFMHKTDTYVCMSIHVCTHTYMYMCINTCINICKYTCIYIYLHIQMCTTNVQPDLQTCARMHLCSLTRILCQSHTYTYTYLHTYRKSHNDYVHTLTSVVKLHMYMHTHMCVVLQNAEIGAMFQSPFWNAHKHGEKSLQKKKKQQKNSWDQPSW